MSLINFVIMQGERFLHSPSYFVKANNYWLIYTMFSSLRKASPLTAATRLDLVTWFVGWASLVAVDYDCTFTLIGTKCCTTLLRWDGHPELLATFTTAAWTLPSFPGISSSTFPSFQKAILVESFFNKTRSPMEMRRLLPPLDPTWDRFFNSIRYSRRHWLVSCWRTSVMTGLLRERMICTNHFIVSSVWSCRNSSSIDQIRRCYRVRYIDSLSSYTYVRGLELMTPLISTKTVRSLSKLRVDLPRIFFKGFLMLLTSRSQNPPHHKAFFDNKVPWNLLVRKVLPNFFCSGYFTYVLRWRPERLGVIKRDGSRQSSSTRESSEDK